tara:strand:- start:223 stop:600 length:378 start_codon:yes stop_codon:yes gene_type:complete
MSWFTVVKKAELLPPKPKAKPKVGPKTKVSNTIGDIDQCCEDAFESVNIWMDQNNLAISPEWPPDGDPIQDIRELIKTCASLKRFINSSIKSLRDDRSPAKDEVQHIMEVWEKCDAGDIGSGDLI